MVDPDPEEPGPVKPWSDVSRAVPKKVRDKGEIATARWSYLFSEESKLSNEYAEKWTTFQATVKRLTKGDRKPTDEAVAAEEKQVMEGFWELRALGVTIYEMHEERMTLQGDR